MAVIVITGTLDGAVRGRALTLGALIADDEEEMRDVLRDFVESHDSRVLLAEDGVSALRRIIDEQPDIVLLDIQMPRLGGVEALTAILAVAPSTRVIDVDFTYLENSLETAVRMRE